MDVMSSLVLSIAHPFACDGVVSHLAVYNSGCNDKVEHKVNLEETKQWIS